MDSCNGASRHHLEGRDPILILSAHNRTVQALRCFFNRRIPIWEGETRDALTALASKLEQGAGDANAVVLALVNFMDEVSVGFTATDYTKFLWSEVAAGCTKKRSLKPATLQGLPLDALSQNATLPVAFSANDGRKNAPPAPPVSTPYARAAAVEPRHPDAGGELFRLARFISRVPCRAS